MPIYLRICVLARLKCPVLSKVEMSGFHGFVSSSPFSFWTPFSFCE